MKPLRLRSQDLSLYYRLVDALMPVIVCIDLAQELAKLLSIALASSCGLRFHSQLLPNGFNRMIFVSTRVGTLCIVSDNIRLGIC